MIKITFKSYIEWEDYARDYCEETIERIFEMPEQKQIDSIVEEVLYRGFADEYNISAMDVEISDALKREVESGVRAYISEQIEANVVSAPIFETICDALDNSLHNEWSEAYLKENKKYTKADLCTMLHDWLNENDRY